MTEDKRDYVLYRMYSCIKFNRPINKTEDYISPGGYAFKMNGNDFEFDFCEYMGKIDNADPTILYVEQRVPDIESFPCIYEMTEEHIKNITDILEFFVYTGEPGESDLRPIELLECTLETNVNDRINRFSVSKDVLKKAML